MNEITEENQEDYLEILEDVYLDTSYHDEDGEYYA